MCLLDGVASSLPKSLDADTGGSSLVPGGRGVFTLQAELRKVCLWVTCTHFETQAVWCWFADVTPWAAASLAQACDKVEFARGERTMHYLQVGVLRPQTQTLPSSLKKSEVGLRLS